MVKQKEQAEMLNINLALTVIRKMAGMTQKELNDLIGVNHGWVCKIERGEYNAGMDTVIQYCSALGLMPSQIIQFAEVVEDCQDWKSQVVTFASIIGGE